MPRPRHPEEAHHSPRHPPRRSPRTPRTPRTPITPAKSPRYEHRDRRRPLSEDLDDETEAHFSPTPVRAHDRFQRLSRMLVQPWGHHIPAPPPPMPPFPPPARPRQPPPKRDRLKEANQHIVWAKAFAMLLSGAACLCFILAFCFDEVMDVKLPGFTSGEDHTGATTITLAFGDRSTLPPGSPISGWHQEGFFFVIRFSSVFAGVSSLLAVLFIAQGKRIRKMAPSLLAEPFLGVADRLHPVQYKRTPYGTAYIKLWSYGFAILLPTAALVLILRALSSTAGYVSGLSDIGNSSKTSLAMSGILNIVGFTLTVLAGLGHVQEQRLRVQLCRVEDRLQASEPPSSAAPMLPTEVHLPADDYPEDEYLSPTIYDDEKTEISTVPPPRRKKSRRRPPPEALTEVAETEVTRQPESYRTPVKRTRSDNRAGGHRRIEPEPDTPSSRKSQKDVYAEWGEPLQ